MKIAIFHFQPIEKYPPILNLIHQLDKYAELKVVVFTLYCSPAFTENLEKIKVVSLGIPEVHSLFKKLNYILFNLLSTLRTFVFLPKKVFYYETISCFPAIIYKKVFKDVPVLVHYHEYVSPEEYLRGMVLVRILNKLEKENLKNFKWISHTNQDRLKLFLEDNRDHKLKFSTLNVVQNFPPQSWRSSKEKSLNKNAFVKFVYIGYSFDSKTSYIREFLQWISWFENVSFDAYLVESSEEIKRYERQYERNFKVLKAVPYSLLPVVLKNYDIGLILYKAHILNYKYNAPNKLFEYYTCGLDVWYPREILGCANFITKDTYPKVVSINFNNLKGLNLGKLVDKSNCSIEVKEFYAENENLKLIQELISNG